MRSLPSLSKTADTLAPRSGFHPIGSGKAKRPYPTRFSRVPANGSFRYRTMFAEIPLPMESPVYVSHAEANAYARWAGKALPTEAQWQRAAEGAQPPPSTRALWDPPPVGIAPQLSSVWGVEDLIGTGWEWTSTEFAPFPGFQIVAAYPGYSANFFDGKHFVMKGGSTRTAACMLRIEFPELVPGPLSVCLRRLPLRRSLIPYRGISKC